MIAAGPTPEAGSVVVAETELLFGEMVRPRRVRYAVLTLGLAASAASACGTFGSDVTPENDAATPDGRDASSDTSEGSTAEAAAEDAGVDASCVGWCKCRPQPTDFCDDFDDLAGEAGGGWSRLEVGADASADFVTTDFVSATRSMHFMTPFDNVQVREAVLVHENVGTLEAGKVVRVSLDAKADFSSGLCVNEDVSIVTIGLRQLMGVVEEVHFRLNTAPGSDTANFVVQQSSSFPTQTQTISLASDPIHSKWARLTVVASLAAVDGGANELLGRLFVGSPGAHDAGPLVAEGSVRHNDTMKFVDVTVGLRRTYQSVPCRLLIDNVRISVD